MKSEPDVFSILDLKQKSSSLWDGVRNYQARNYMMQSMAVGDLILFYHSNASPPGIAGTAVVGSTAIADPTQFDSESAYFDPKSTRQSPRWFCVSINFRSIYQRLISLDELRTYSELNDMLVLKKGQRLSIQPVTKEQFNFIESLNR